jgi:hypothetical protein
MITVLDLRQKAARQYEAVLRAMVTGETLFPMPMRADKRLSADPAQRRRELANLLAHSHERRGYGYTLTYRRVQTRSLNEQDEIEAVCFPTEADYLRFLEKDGEAERFRADLSLITASFPTLRDWCVRYPLKVIEQHGRWPDLLVVCQYLHQNPAPGCYARELPVPVHTKFIEENHPLLHDLLNRVVPLPADQQTEPNFYARFGLRQKEPGVRLRLVGEPLATVAGPITELTVPVSTLAQLALPEQDVFIIENEINFLTFPPRPDTLVLWGKGFDVSTLARIGWLAQKRLFYWSDLDVQGFEMLSQLRGRFPDTSVQSWLMDWETLHRYEPFWVSGTYKNLTSLPNLTPDETRVFQFLQPRNLRLEQERITQADVLAELVIVCERS